MPAPGSATLRRIVPAAVLLGAVLVLAALYLSPGKPLAAAILDHWLVAWNDPPFDDGIGAVGAMVCERQGIETYIANPCDPQGRPFVYPPLWKLAAWLPVTPAWGLPVVLAWVALFLGAMFVLPAAPDRRGVVLTSAAMLSPPVLMAIEYGNNEMVLFALAVAAAWLLGRGPRARRIAYALVLLAGMLKYFPFAALASVWRERRAVAIGWAFGALALLAAYALVAGNQFALSLGNIFAMSPLSYVFGARNLSQMALAFGGPPAVALAVRAAFSLAVLAAAWRLARTPALSRAVAGLPGDQRDFLLVGALLTLAAWLLTQNVDYRMVYLLMVLPGLMHLSRALPDSRLRGMPWLVLALMLAWPVRYHAIHAFPAGSAARDAAGTLGVVLREAGWLALATGLAALVLCALRERAR